MNLHHLAFRTDDVEALARFYETVLGLTRRRAPRPEVVWLALGDGAIMLEPREPHEPGIPQGSQEFVAFTVSSEARLALRETLAAEGRLEHETLHTLYFRDPDGRRVGVSTYPFLR